MVLSLGESLALYGARTEHWSEAHEGVTESALKIAVDSLGPERRRSQSSKR
jgi:hypothetical protein